MSSLVYNKSGPNTEWQSEAGLGDLVDELMRSKVFSGRETWTGTELKLLC